MLQVDNALTAAHNVLFSKGLDTAVATSRQQHAANVEAAHEAREAYLKKACFCSWNLPWRPFPEYSGGLSVDRRPKAVW